MKQYQQPNRTERQLRKTLRETITPEQYHAVLQRLITTAISADKDIDATNAAKIIIDRLEGKLPETITHTITGVATIDDLLKDNIAGELQAPEPMSIDDDT